MKHYVELTLLPDAETSLGFLWQRVYQQIHLMLVEHQATSIGVCFPQLGQTSFPLGAKLRLFAPNEAALTQLDIATWLARFSDYVHLTSVKAVPETASAQACVQRRQIKSNVGALIRRRMKRKGESQAQATAHYAGYQESRSQLPFIEMQSLSSQHRYKLFIDQSSDLTEPVKGEFNSFGFGNGGTTVPWF